jgi:hypothetical protein
MRIFRFGAAGCNPAVGNRKKNEDKHSRTADALRQTLGQPWPTQGVDSEAQAVVQKSVTLGLGEARGVAVRDANRDQAYPTL